MPPKRSPIVSKTSRVALPGDFRNAPWGFGVTVTAAHPCGLIAVDKPSGVRSHPNKPGADRGSLLTCAYDAKEERYSWENPDGNSQRIYLLNRLDSPTSGLVLLATSASLAKTVQEAFARHEVEKVYYALVRGNAAGCGGTWRNRMSAHPIKGKIRSTTGSGVSAETLVRRLRPGRGRIDCALLEMHPKTGRTHQLRVQTSERRLPVIGDATYGDFRFNREVAKLTGEKRLFLHAAQVALTVPWRGKTVRFAAESPLPATFGKILGEQ